MQNYQARTQPGNLFFESTVDGYVKTPRLIRREWLSAEVNRRLKDPDCTFVLLFADPGVGKSTFMAQLAYGHPEWPRYFIRRDQRTPLADVAVHSFLLRIGYQLAAAYPELFSEEQVRISVEQRVESLESGGEMIGVEVKRILASPFYEKVIQIRQHAAHERGKMVGLRVEELMVDPRLMEPEMLAKMALVDPANALMKLRPKEQIVVLVDALDEIRYHDTQDNIIKWLTNCPALPSNIRFVLSSRPADTALKLFSEKQAGRVEILNVTTEVEEVRMDVLTYFERLCNEPQVAAELSVKEIEVDGFQTQLGSKANGNIGYAAALARAMDDAMESGDKTRLGAILDFQDLPDDLEDLYAFFLLQIKAEVEAKGLAVPVDTSGIPLYLPAWPAVYQPLLSVLSVALAPLSADQIKVFIGNIKERSYVLDALSRLRQFLSESGGNYRLYHATLAEFLTNKDTKEKAETTDLYADPVEWHAAISSCLWEAHSQDWSSLDDYGLNSLATHLHRGEQFKRLAELINQPWMRVRFNRGGFTYDGFIADLMLAWEHAYQQSLIEIEADHRMYFFSECVWYAMIRTNINSIAGRYKPDLVSLAVETGYWSVERALSTVKKLSDSHQRVLMIAGLLNTSKISSNLRSLLIEDVLEEVVSSESYYQRYKTLLVLIPYLSSEYSEKVERVGLEVFKSEFLTNWNGQVYRGEFLTAIAPILTGDSLKAGLEIADSITDRYWRARALIALIPRLDGKDRMQALQMSFGRAQSLDSNEKKAELFQLVVPFLTDEMSASALKSAREIRDPYFRVKALVAVGQSRVEKIKKQAIKVSSETVKLIVDPYERARALIAFAQILDSEDRKIVVKDALLAARKIKNTENRIRVMIELVPLLTGASQKSVVRSTIADALSIELPDFRADYLADLAPMLSGENLRGVLDEGLKTSAAPKVSEVYEALIPLAPFLESKLATSIAKTSMPLLIDYIDRAKDGQARFEGWEQSVVEFLIALAPALEKPTRAETIKLCLNTFPYLDRVTKVSLLAEASSWLSNEEYQEHARQPFNEAYRYEQYEERLSIPFDDRVQSKEVWYRNKLERVEVIAALASILTSESSIREELLTTGLNLALNNEIDRYRAYALTVLAQHLGIEQHKQVVAAALDFEKEEEKTIVLSAIAPYLQGELVVQVRESLSEIKESINRAEVMAGLASKFPDEPELMREIRLAMADLFSPQLQDSDVGTVLKRCSLRVLFKYPILDPRTIDDLASIIMVVNTQWEWL